MLGFQVHFPSVRLMCKSVGIVRCALNFFAIFCLLAGLDASAQTTSHELTIPNDVSKNRGYATLNTLGKKMSYRH